MELHTSTNTFGGDASTRKCRQKVGIEPTSVSIVARHNGANNAVILKSDEEEVVVDGDFFVDGQLRVVSGVGVTKDFLPELDGALGV